MTSSGMPNVRVSERDAARQRGFTIMEVLVALLIFAISVVGLVAMEARGIEAQRAANEVRDAERLAQQVMADMLARGFDEFVQRDFAGAANPVFPYGDTTATAMSANYHSPPVDSTSATPGSVQGVYRVFRRVDRYPANAAQPAGSANGVDALTFEVIVLWLDYSNPLLPPPETAKVGDLKPEMIDPTNAEFQTYVAHVRLRTVRMNDGLDET